MEGTEERISERQDRKKKIPQSEQKRKNGLKKVTEPQGPLGLQQKIYHSCQQNPGKKRKRAELKTYSKT